MKEVSELQQELIQLQEELRKEREEKCQALCIVEILELEIERATESERRMLDSLTSQTKQLEQTKISLEEAKLEIKSLNETIRTLESPNEIKKIRTELKLALEAEKKSKKAMDDLALALKEVTTESNRAKKSYFQTQSELGKLRAEAERLKLEAEETFAAWREKENGFINCIKISEEEIAYTKKENRRLIESQRAAREEISKLRDIVKQAVNESNVVKEALEIARTENSQLKDLLSDKENAFRSIKQDYECLKVSEAAAMDSVKELSGLLAATSSLDYDRSGSSFDAGGGGISKPMEKFPLENWRSPRWHSAADSGRLEGSIFDLSEPSPEKEKDWALDYRENMEGDSPTRQKKKRQILRRFGDILRIRSFHK